MAQFGVLIYVGDSAHAPGASGGEIAECDEHAEELVGADAMVGAWAFTPRDMATSVRSGGVTEGPYVDGADIVAGFYIVEAQNLDGAVAIARTNPALRADGGLEIRPIHSGGMVERSGN
jgi:hypothetical protein